MNTTTTNRGPRVQLTGKETHVLLPAPRLGMVAPASTATWHRVEAFKRHEDGTIFGVYVKGQLMRRAHVVLDAK